MANVAAIMKAGLREIQACCEVTAVVYLIITSSTAQAAVGGAVIAEKVYWAGANCP